MASSPSNSNSEPATIEQVITEFFAKSLHIILESRSPSSPSSSSSGRPRDKWFNLALRDCPAALGNFDLWRQSNLEPLIVDVILVRRWSKEPPSESWSSRHDEFLSYDKSEKIVERWVVQYESRKSNSIPCGRLLPVRISVLLRSLYTTVRLLPAYRVFRELSSSGQICSFSLSHRISSFVKPFTRAQDAEMNQFSFVPIDTPCGTLSLSVSYLPTLEDVSSEPSTPMSAQFIPDYVGSPTTDPLKRLQSLPSAGSLPTYISFTRRHGWRNDREAPSVSPSPSPTYSDSRALEYTPSPSLPPRSNPSDKLNPSTLPYKRNTSFDEYWPSPPFSPSSSPSPPTHLPGTHLRNPVLRSESAPVSIPVPRLRLVSHGLPPSPSLKSGKTETGCSHADLLRAQVTTASASETSCPESKLQLKKSSCDLYSGMTLQKILYCGKDEVGNLSGRKLSSCSSPRIPSRTSSRYSFLDDEFDDSEFSCPFTLDDEDLTDSYRVEPTDADGDNMVSGELIPVRRSPDALVGALVRMLKTAAPLRQDLLNSVVPSPYVKDEVSNHGIQYNKVKEAGMEKFDTASGLSRSRTAADALEELKRYKEMKEVLLRQSGSQSFDVDLAKIGEKEENVEQAENYASEDSSRI